MREAEHFRKSEGYCLCKKVTVSLSGLDRKVVACSCKNCRRWGVSSSLSIDGGDVPGFAGREHVGIYDSASVERGFCRACGSHLFYRVKKSGVYYFPVGIFDAS